MVTPNVRIRVNNYQLGQNLITWNSFPNAQGFRVYRARDKKDGDYTELPPSGVVTSFLDTTVEKKPYVHYWYKVRNNVGGLWSDLSLETPVSSELDTRNIFTSFGPALRAQLDIMFDHGKAESCQIWVRPQAGTRCPVCWDDDVKDSRGNVWCTTCHNTTYAGGYIYMGVFKVRLSYSGDNISPTAYGFELQQGRQGQLRYYPIVKSGDLIIRPNGERFLVDNDVKSYEPQGYLLKQSFALRLVEPTHGLYNVQ